MCICLFLYCLAVFTHLTLVFSAFKYACLPFFSLYLLSICTSYSIIFTIPVRLSVYSCVNYSSFMYDMYTWLGVKGAQSYISAYFLHYHSIAPAPAPAQVCWYMSMTSLCDCAISTWSVCMYMCNSLHLNRWKHFLYYSQDYRGEVLTIVSEGMVVIGTNASYISDPNLDNQEQEVTLLHLLFTALMRKHFLQNYVFSSIFEYC